MKHLKPFQRILAALVVSFLLIGCNPPLPQSPPTDTVLIPTQTLLPSLTPTSSSTPFPAVSPSPFPTRTATPLPEWVEAFAEPVLAAIAGRAPDVQEDFSEVGPNWYLEDTNCPNQGCSLVEGALSVTAYPVDGKSAWAGQPFPCCSGFKSFVLRVDVNTSRLSGENSAAIFYTDTIIENQKFTWASEYTFELKSGRRWYSIIGPSGIHGGDFGQLPRSISPRITFTLISRGSKFAIYLNDMPVTFGDHSGGQYQPEFSLDACADGESKPAYAEFDNLMIWNLDNLPNLP